MLNSVVEKAKRLNLGECSHGRNLCSHSGRRNPLFVTDSETDLPTRDFSATRGGFTSDTTPSGGGAGSHTSDFGPTPSQASVTHIPSPPGFDCSQDDPLSRTPLTVCGSPGAQTLAAVKQEAIRDRSLARTSGRTTVKSKTPRRRIARRGKIMREEYFEGMSWTRVFVSGPLDPEHNPYKFSCLICKDNVSIHTKSPREILRHYSSERHLRKDQRWSYKYLSVTDTITGIVKHRVRGKDGKLLTPYQLELELPNFIDAVLVDFGDRMPFFRGLHGRTARCHHLTRQQSSSTDLWINEGSFLPVFEDISIFRSLWSNLGSVMGLEASFLGFNWGKERLLVSTFDLVR